MLPVPVSTKPRGLCRGCADAARLSAASPSPSLTSQVLHATLGGSPPRGEGFSSREPALPLPTHRRRAGGSVSPMAPRCWSSESCLPRRRSPWSPSPSFAPDLWWSQPSCSAEIRGIMEKATILCQHPLKLLPFNPVLDAPPPSDCARVGRQLNLTKLRKKLKVKCLLFPQEGKCFARMLLRATDVEQFVNSVAWAPQALVRLSMSKIRCGPTPR